MKDRSSRFPVSRSTMLLALVAGVAPVVAFACSSSTTNTFTTGSGGGETTSGGGNGAGGNKGQGGSGGDIFKDSGPTSGLKIGPSSPTLKVEVPLAGQTVQFTCTDLATNMPAVGAAWSLDTPALGDIDANGKFTPNGARPGSVKITCKKGMDSADTTLTVLIHAIDNSGVGMQDMGTLRGPPGMADSTWQFVYPYDQTVFPRGIPAPEIHLTSGSNPGNAFYVHILADKFEYEGFFNAGGQTQLNMSQAAWDALTGAAKGSQVEVDVSKIANGQKFGPIFRHWTLAAGTLHGTIYYNTYNSPLANNDGAMMRIKGNSPVPEVLVGQCTVCHSISSDGSTAAAANHNGPGGIFDLTNGNPNPPLVYQDAEIAAFAGLFPKNGSVWVVNAEPNWGPTPGSGGGYASSLRAKNGMVIPNSGIEGYYAQSPVFSHDGTHLAFLDRSHPGAASLAMMDYDAVAQKFTNYQVMAVPGNGRINSWPAFTPDNKWIVFQSGTGQDLATWGGNSKIFAVDVATKTVIPLDVLNGDGYAPAGQRDLDLNFEPTIAPIASGGFYWVMFTSRRTYGNKLTSTQDQTKRLWVSAFDINAIGGQDGSHPAFYISGQELTSGNSRGFWALDPCKSDGADCQTGDECCNGFCEPMGNPPKFTCGPPSGMCSKEFESCKVDSDCCDPTLVCINNTCTFVPPK
jgi:hypothetical protein